MPEDLRERAGEVLHINDAGGWTKAAPQLYPHQWSWDSAFIAVGWAQLDPGRALAELEHLFAAQWRNGMVPHIVFDPALPEGEYFPDRHRWDCEISEAAPAPPMYTSGLCQPPVHALALLRIWEQTASRPDIPAAPIRDRLRALWPAVFGWHHYLATARDPDRSGLVTIYHPWEGADNSPRWDEALAAITVGDLPPYRRRDTQHITDLSQRPTDADYDRYIWLVELLKRHRYDDKQILRDYPFLIQDVFFTAVLVAANTALLELAEVIGAADEQRNTIAGWIERGRRGLADHIDPELGLCLDYDIRAGRPIRSRTFAGFAPLIAGAADPAQREALLDRLDSEAFIGNPRLRWPLLPSTSPLDPAFEPRNYWRGPTWPVINWLLWRSLRRDGQPDRAQRIRDASVAQVAAGGFSEYFEPITGEALGSPQQAWTAAVVLDWLARP